ncbi:MAG: YjbH domain-containing protein [Rhodoferax sp.]
MRQSKLWALCLGTATLTAPALAQLSAGGFTGAINSPTADVMSPGTVSGSWTNSIPEKKRDYPDAGYFGSLNLGFGVLPGLEVIGRLAYDGDLQCNMYSVSPPCQSWTRDLSASTKYQFPLRLGWDTRLAIGAVDIGGAATNFRSFYGVATSTFGSVDVTLGYGRGDHTYSSPDGPFGSAQVFLTDNWRALAEYDSRELRAGMRYARALTEQLGMEAQASYKLSSRTDQQAWQAGLSLTYSFDKRALSEGTRKEPAKAAAAATAPAAGASAPVTPTVTPTAAPAAPAKPPVAAQPVLAQASAPTASAAAPALAAAAAGAATAPLAPDSTATPVKRAEQLASRMRAAGFSSVQVGFDDLKSWVVQAEPLAWRKNRLDALGMALSLWKKSAQDNEHVHLVLSYLQDPVLTASTSMACLKRFTEGGNWCDGKPALTMDNGQSAHAPAQGWLLSPASPWEVLRPQFEIGPVLKQRVGTEYGLYDASVGLDLAWELQLKRGVLFQGEVTLPLANTSDFDAGQPFGYDRIQSRVENSVVSMQKQLGTRFWGQASAGYVQHNDYGAQLDLAWLSPAGGLRLSGVAGYYQGSDTSGQSLQSIRHPIALASARWSVIDGRWFLEAQAGQFYNQDLGIRLASHHWFGDNRLTLHYRNTESSGPVVMPRTQFAGFQITMPIGSRVSTALGQATLRGSDQWAYGIETKVGGTDNYIASGYGVVPGIRHNLLTDTLDFDRAGLSDINANLYRVRAMLREAADKP